MRAWSAIKDDAKEDAYESLRVRLKDAEQVLVRVKGVAVVEHSKRERAEGVLDALAAWMSKLVEMMKGEYLGASFYFVAMYLG